MDYVAVHKRDTKEIIACIPLEMSDGAEAIVKDDVDFKFYRNGSEPVFTELPCGGIALKENTITIKNL